MPRGFTEQEKALIRQRLLEQGRLFLARYGLRKTSVEDLTRAAGISKGAFYAFFPSKEDLFFTIFEQFEADYQAALLAQVEATGEPAEARLRTFLQHALTVWRTSPLFQHFDKNDFDYLVRKVAPERTEAALRSDEAFAERLLQRWQASGLALTCSPAELTGLLRALFFVSLHAADIGATSAQTIALLRDLVARHLADAQAPIAPKQAS
jgi:AcrR family transcriptional regulator